MSSFILLADAKEMTARFRQHRENILDTFYRDQDILPVCETFDKSQVEALLNRTGCSALRCYYGMDEDYRVHLVLVGVNTEDEDMLPPGTLTEEEEDDDYLIERATRCPPNCPPESDLNS